MNPNQPHQSASSVEEFDVREVDVLNGRGKVDHPGNAFYRQTIMEHCPQYKECWTKKDRDGMDLVVQSIIDKIHARGGRFMEQNWRKVWTELSTKDRKQKVDRACRDTKIAKPSKQVTMSGMCTEPSEQVQPTSQHSTVPLITESSSMQSVEDKPLQDSTILSVGSGIQQTNITNITLEPTVDQRISSDLSADALLLPKHIPPVHGGRSEGNLKKLPESTSCERKVLRKGATGLMQKTDECTCEQALNFDQMSFANCESESIHEEQKFQVAATLLEFSSSNTVASNTVATHTPDLDFSCGSMSYSSGTNSYNLGDREGETRRVGLNDTAPAVKPSSLSGPRTAVGSGSKSSLLSSSTSLDLFKVEEERHMGAELGDSSIMTMQMGSLNDSIMDMSSVGGENDSFVRILPLQQCASDRTVTASNKRKKNEDSLSDLLNGSLDFNDSGQEGNLENSASSTSSQVARGNGKNKVTNTNQRSPLDDIFHSSESSNETAVSHMSVTTCTAGIG